MNQIIRSAIINLSFELHYFIFKLNFFSLKGDFQMTTFSDRLKEAMYAQNLKQIDLVHIAAENNVKLGKSHVSQYVSGKTVPRNDILHFLADTLHVDCLLYTSDAADEL